MDLSMPPPPPQPNKIMLQPTNGNINGNVNGSGVNGNPTELLEKSIQKLKINDNQNFQKEAGKVLTSMLQSRIYEKNPVPTIIIEQQQHPMKTILNLCDTLDSSTPPALPKSLPPVLDNHKFHNEILLIPNVRSGPLSPRTPPPSFFASTLFDGDETCIPVNTNIYPLENNTKNVSNQYIPIPVIESKINIPNGHSNQIPNININNNSINVNGVSTTNELENSKEQEPSRRSHNKNNQKTDNKSSIRKSLIFDSQNFQNNETNTNNNQTIIHNNNNNDKEIRTIADELNEGKDPICWKCNKKVPRGPFITALGHIWCPDHFICTTANCRRPLQDIGFVEEKGQLYCEFCFEKYLAPTCSKCSSKIKGDCLNAIGKHYHPECFTCGYCGKLFGNSAFFLEEGEAYCENDWNELFTTKCFACGFPVEAGDRWVEALSHNYHSQCFNCTMCKKNLEGQSFIAKSGRPFCKNHGR